MTDCVDEQQTQHYRGKWFGFGPVRNGERVRFAVFEQTKREGARLIGNSFRNLKNSNESVVRSSYVTRSDFDTRIVSPGMAAKGRLVGIAVADVSRIRALRADVKLNQGTVKVRSICVIDRVEDGDIDGHATMGYASIEDGVSTGQIGTIRINIRMDLANEFTEIVTPDDHQWASRLELLLKRAGCVVQVLFATLETRWEQMKCRRRLLISG
jgi:hypothetical protein